MSDYSFEHLYLKCRVCHCFGTHQLIHNIKANTFIIKAKKLKISGRAAQLIAMKPHLEEHRHTKYDQRKYSNTL